MSVTHRPPSPAWQCLTGISKHKEELVKLFIGVNECLQFAPPFASRVACGLINLVCKRLGFQLRRARGLQESKGPSTLRSKAKCPLMLTEVEANLQQAYHKSVAYHHCWAVEVPPCHSAMHESCMIVGAIWTIIFEWPCFAQRWLSMERVLTYAAKPSNSHGWAFLEFVFIGLCFIMLYQAMAHKWRIKLMHKQRAVGR